MKKFVCTICGYVHEVDAGFRLRRAGKFQIAAKAVLCDGIFFPSDSIRLVLQAADNRKQDRRMACPDRRVCLPDIFRAGGSGFHGAELRALAVNDNRENFILNRILHRSLSSVPAGWFSGFFIISV